MDEEATTPVEKDETEPGEDEIERQISKAVGDGENHLTDEAGIRTESFDLNESTFYTANASVRDPSLRTSREDEVRIYDDNEIETDNILVEQQQQWALEKESIKAEEGAPEHESGQNQQWQDEKNKAEEEKERLELEDQCDDNAKMQIVEESSSQLNLDEMDQQAAQELEGTHMQGLEAESGAHQEPEKDIEIVEVAMQITERKKSGDEGEIASDHEESSKKLGTEGTRKRNRELEAEDGIETEPKTKKAALERLRNMRFVSKDPFKDNPPRDSAKFSLLSSRTFRDRTPPLQRKSTEEFRRRDRTREEGKNGQISRRRRSRSRTSRHKTDSAVSIIEARHMRGTMYLLQAEQKVAVMVAPQLRSNPPVGAKPLKERIDALLAKPDNEVLVFPAAEIKSLLLSGVELYRDQEHFLSGRKAQLIELNSMISQEREAIERISQELPPQYRPRQPIDELLASSQRIPQDGPHTAPTPLGHPPPHLMPPFATSKQPNFTVPPPSFNMGNEFRALPGMPPIPPHQFMRPPPMPPLPQQNSVGITQFGHTPSLLFTNPPPTSVPNDFAKGVSLSSQQFSQINHPNSNFTKNDSQQQQQGSQTKQAPISLASIPPLSRPPDFPNVPLQTGISMAQQQETGQPVVPISHTATQLIISNSLKSIHATTATIDLNKPPSSLIANSSAKLFTPNQQPPRSEPSANFVQPSPVSLQQIAAAANVPIQQRTPTQFSSSPVMVSSSTSASPKQSGGTSQQTPRPLMSLNVGLPQPQHTSINQQLHQSMRQSTSGQPQQQQQPGKQFAAHPGNIDGRAEQTQASVGGTRRGRGKASMRGRLTKTMRGRGGGGGGGALVTRKFGKTAADRKTGGTGARGEHRRRRNSSHAPSPWPSSSSSVGRNGNGDWGTTAGTTSFSVQTWSPPPVGDGTQADSSTSGPSAKQQKMTEGAVSFKPQKFQSAPADYQMQSCTDPPVVVQAADTTTNASVADEDALPISP